MVKGCSSAGRATVSKTVGRGFESCHPCQKYFSKMNKKNLYSTQEERVLSFWRKDKIFEKSVDSRNKNNSYVFYDGPPFATGLPHYGHILSSVTKDLFPRYQTMLGKRVRRRWGWDCHGLPIETLVEKELGVSGKKEIEAKGVESFNRSACSMVLSYVKQWKEMIDRIGRWVEFDNSYKTMDSTYMESVWWALKTLWDKKLVYEGRKVLMYCPRCETPVSNAEVSMDNSYKDVTEDSVTVKFKIVDPEKHCLPQNSYFLAWTTTPWTLPANVALAVGADIEYALVKDGADYLLLAKETIVKLDKKLKSQKIFKGSELEGLQYEPLYQVEKVEKSKDEAWYVALADFVNTQEGTGIVHTAIIYGEDDFNLGQRLSLPQVPLLDSSGKYNEDAPEFLLGKYIKDVEGDIISDLEKRGLLFQVKPHTHSYPFCWRCDSPLIYNAISAWFVDIQSQKERIIELNEKINWYPENLKYGRFLNILKDAPDWNISRNRYWATPLPFFRCENKDCREVTCVGSLGELKEKAKNYSDVYKSDKIEEVDLHRPYIDDIILKCPKCGGNARRIPEVIDCWVESASMPFAEWHYPFENKKDFESRFPGQFIGEYVAQTRAWFYYMHALSVLLFDDISFENVVSTGTILSEKGEKLSKSKKNYPDPWIIIDKYGADSLRFYLMNSVVMQSENLFFSEVDLKDIYSKVINTGYNIANYYKIYEGDYKKGESPSGKNILDRWIISRLQSTLAKTTEYLNEYNTVKSSREIKLFIEDFSTWWLRRSRDRFKSQTPDSQDAFSALEYSLRGLSCLLAPFTPFLAEHIFQAVRSEGDPESVHLASWPIPEKKRIDSKIEDLMIKARKIVEIGHSIRAKEGIRVRQPLSSISWNIDLAEDLDPVILDELNVLERKKYSGKKIDDLSGLKVFLDTKMTDKLQEMGDVREVVRGIQSARKKAGLKPGEKVELFVEKSESLSEFLSKNKEGVAVASGLSRITERDELEGGFDVNLSFQKAKFSLGKNIQK